MVKLSENEKETNINFTEDGREAVIKTFNADLKHRLAEFAHKFPLFCRLENFTVAGSVTYVIDKSRLSIRLLPPSGEEHRTVAKEYAEERGFRIAQSGKETA